MSAINSAANPVSAVISPSTSGAGKPAASANSGERPFATVMAEQSGKAPKSTGKEQGASTPAKATSTADNDTEDAVPATVTAAPVAPLVQSAMPPIDALKATDIGMGEEGIDARAQAAAALIQAVLQPNGAGPALPESTVIGNASAAIALTTTATGPALGTEAGVGADPRGESIADMRLAIARNARGEAAPDTGDTPAKLAAPQEVFALPTETRSVAATDFLAGKSDAGLAQAAASMAAAAPMHAAAAAAQTSHGGEYRIVTPVGSQQWETAVGNSLVVMTGSRQDRAELILTPPQLGRIEVSISMKGDEANAIFVSANPAVRDAIESSLPRLREVLAEAGITLGQTQVGAESQGQWASERQNGDNAARRGVADTAGDDQLLSGAENRTSTAHRVVSRSLVDTYA